MHRSLSVARTAQQPFWLKCALEPGGPEPLLHGQRRKVETQYIAIIALLRGRCAVATKLCLPFRGFTDLGFPGSPVAA
jgi:hypothetical protein